MTWIIPMALSCVLRTAGCFLSKIMQNPLLLYISSIDVIQRDVMSPPTKVFFLCRMAWREFFFLRVQGIISILFFNEYNLNEISRHDTVVTVIQFWWRRVEYFADFVNWVCPCLLTRTFSSECTQYSFLEYSHLLAFRI